MLKNQREAEFTKAVCAQRIVRQPEQKDRNGIGVHCANGDKPLAYFGPDEKYKIGQSEESGVTTTTRITTDCQTISGINSTPVKLYIL